MPPDRAVGSYLLAFLLLLCCHSAIVNGSSHGHHHDGRRHETRATVSLSEAESMLKDAHRTMHVMNKGRLDYPQFNTYDFQLEPTAGQFVAAQALDEKPVPAIQPATLRIGDNATVATPVTARNFTYTVSPELAEAARLVAEASPEPLPGDYGVDLDTIFGQYRLKTNNDTNTPRQKYWTPNGLDGVVVQAGSEIEQPMEENTLQKRVTTDFWLTTMAQRGSSPFAPDGYKVWRNVMDYGAKGDGVTDDTAAINLAISSGGRCGDNCGSSTIYPAFVYFPPGTYLVSSPIIQYYNTEMYGNPFDYPTILAASSFVGLGVITSDVYTGDTTEWYLNTNNFLRSIRNFKMDIRRTQWDAYVCAIHWQVAQGTSLENIIFYMVQDDTTTQQGVYMENGSGGFLSNLTFVGGNFGAYFGNQQFTTSQLSFKGCRNALQVHWDWAWTMQNVIIHDCTNGIVIVGGAGGPGSTGQSVGSLVLLDILVSFTETAILTSLFSENSTSFLIQNAQFIGVDTAIYDNVQGKALLAGGNQVTVDSWGFGQVATSSTNSTFVNGQNIPAMNRTESPLVGSDGYLQRNFFQRRRPTYTDIGMSQVIDAKAWGAAGDGVTDDAGVLNSIFERAANMSSIVFLPFGVYVIKDTLHVPVGSRIIGQAWSQIMIKGPKFQNEKKPRVGVQVGKPGDTGIIEIQSLLFTVSGPTAGAILMEWNVHESTQGSAGMWDSHFRVGGAIGSDLQVSDCPKETGTVNAKCRAASLHLHLTPTSSAYMENIWVWTADHDLDIISQDQIDIYTGRGVLIESQGPTWLYGTASEHNVLYQYQVSQAKNLYMSMIQTESPYFQPVPKAPSPFQAGLFPNDPDFSDCDPSDKTCALSWGLRILDSESIYLMGAGLYSWFSDYNQDCLDTEDCQKAGVYIAEATDTWLYNVVTKGTVEMVSPVNEVATLAANNVNGFMSSILAWIRQGKTIGTRTFPGFQLYTSSDWMDSLTEICRTALTQKIYCDSYMEIFKGPMTGKYIENATLADSVCDTGCGKSLKSWVDNVEANCGDQRIGSATAALNGGYLYNTWNLTCLKDPETEKYCPSIIHDFTIVDKVASMPTDEMCSYCYTTSLQLRQATPYSAYSEKDKANLQLMQSKCGLDGPTDVPESPFLPETPEATICASDVIYTVQAGDTCDSIALAYGVASASIQSGNSDLVNNCSRLIAGRELCLPLPCDTQYTVQDDDDCYSIERAAGIVVDSVRRYNPWVNKYCTNLQKSRPILGSVICLSPQAGTHDSTAGQSNGTSKAGHSTGNREEGGYCDYLEDLPANATVAVGTTEFCGVWYTVGSDDSCATITMQQGIPASLFLEVNPSLSRVGCDASLVEGTTYCVAPFIFWDDEDFYNYMHPQSSSAIPSPTATAV